MHQRDLHRSVARSTGESISEIARRGFSLADPIHVRHDPEPVEDEFFDWDTYDIHERNVALVDQPVSSLVGHI